MKIQNEDSCSTHRFVGDGTRANTPCPLLWYWRRLSYSLLLLYYLPWFVTNWFARCWRNRNNHFRGWKWTTSWTYRMFFMYNDNLRAPFLSCFVLESKIKGFRTRLFVSTSCAKGFVPASILVGVIRDVSLRSPWNRGMFTRRRLNVQCLNTHFFRGACYLLAICHPALHSRNQLNTE